MDDDIVTPKRKSVEGEDPHEGGFKRPRYSREVTPRRLAMDDDDAHASVKAVHKKQSSLFSRERLSSLPVPPSGTSDGEEDEQLLPDSKVIPKPSERGTALKPPLGRKGAKFPRLPLKNNNNASSNIHSNSSETHPRKRQRPPRLPTASSRKQASVSAATDPSSEGEETVIAGSANLSYSWESLGLGTKMGSAALNQFLRQQNVSSIPRLSPQQVLQIMDSMRVQTILPPENSELHQVIHKTRFDGDGDGDVDEDFDAPVLDLPEESPQLVRKEGRSEDPPATPRSPHPEGGGTPVGTPTSRTEIPYEKLKTLYETMCEQDVDDGSSNRREIRYLTADALMEKLRNLENRACELKLKQDKVLGQAQKLGFADTKLMYELSGYCDPMGRLL